MLETFPDTMQLSIEQTVSIDAAPTTVFESVLQILGPRNEGPDGAPMPMTIEPRPGGRWFRDLGNDQGHLWAHVQVIKAPTLLEMTGPMFMSYPVISHIQLRVEETPSGSDLTLIHRAIGRIDPDHRAGVVPGWAHLLSRVAAHATG